MVTGTNRSQLKFRHAPRRVQAELNPLRLVRSGVGNRTPLPGHDLPAGRRDLPVGGLGLPTGLRTRPAVAAPRWEDAFDGWRQYAIADCLGYAVPPFLLACYDCYLYLFRVSALRWRHWVAPLPVHA